MYKVLVMLLGALFMAQTAVAQTAKTAARPTAKTVDQVKAENAENQEDEDAINWKKVTPKQIEQMIKDEKIKLNEYDYLGETPLMSAAAECAKPEVLETLIKNGTEVDFYPPTDNPEAALATSALFAAAGCNMDIIKMLVEKGASVNVYGEMGMSLLMNVAARTHDPEIVSYLLEKGANVLDLDDAGHHVLMYAVLNQENAHKIIEILLKKGADINMLGITPADETFTVLDFAEQRNLDEDAIKYLREIGAKHAAELY